MGGGKSQESVLVCDLGRSRMRFAKVDGGALGDVEDRPTSEALRRRDGLVGLIREALDMVGLVPGETTVFLSVPIYVSSNTIDLPQPIISWSFDVAVLQERLGVRELKVVNDMAALGLALPLVVASQSLAPIHDGNPRRVGFPMVIIGVRTGLSALGFVLAGEGELRWLPVQTEAGHIGLVATNADEQELIDRLRLTRIQQGEWVVRAQDALSKGGLSDLHRAVNYDLDLSSVEVTADGLVRAAEKGDGPAIKTMQAWSHLMGNFARMMALAYGAWGGLLLAGQLPRAFLADDQTENRRLFNEAFLVPGPSSTYMDNIPVACVTHADPYLLGLSRFLPAP